MELRNTFHTLTFWGGFKIKRWYCRKYLIGVGWKSMQVGLFISNAFWHKSRYYNLLIPLLQFLLEASSMWIKIFLQNWYFEIFCLNPGIWVIRKKKWLNLSNSLLTLIGKLMTVVFGAKMILNFDSYGIVKYHFNITDELFINYIAMVTSKIFHKVFPRSMFFFRYQETNAHK